ncbi:hypothetical protein DBV05_g2907 [Lasiodiplodia theobromae]|uniref:Uncharacterized protein n=1 Tax=Lasiodiplodia theobromae TaxID=45133 RepID=A0A5N5DNW7_9PEZI|nr:hypothetical protein DBV05_g2907 [Lasiodiplodia theobromae]
MTVAAQCRHDIAPYAFNARNDPYREFVVGGILNRTEEDAAHVRRLSEERGLARSIRKAAKACRDGHFSKEAVAHATSMVRRAFQQSGERTAMDDEVQVIDKDLWRMQVRLAKVESALKRATAGGTAPEVEASAGGMPAQGRGDPEANKNQRRPELSPLHAASIQGPSQIAGAASSSKTGPDEASHFMRSPDCQRLHDQFKGNRLISFHLFVPERHVWLQNISTVAKCGDVRYHAAELIRQCKNEHARSNPPVSRPIRRIPSIMLKEGSTWA